LVSLCEKLCFTISFPSHWHLPAFFSRSQKHLRQGLSRLLPSLHASSLTRPCSSTFFNLGCLLPTLPTSPANRHVQVLVMAPRYYKLHHASTKRRCTRLPRQRELLVLPHASLPQVAQLNPPISPFRSNTPPSTSPTQNWNVSSLSQQLIVGGWTTSCERSRRLGTLRILRDR